MKKLMRKCKKAFVLVLSMALVCNSLNFSTLNVYAENTVQMEQELPEEIKVTVSDNEASAEDEMGEVSVTDGDSNEMIPESGILELEDYKGLFILPPTETSAISMSMFSLRNGVVDKISGNAVNWYDRLDLSGDEYQFARDFYANLVEWSDNDGTEDYLIDDAYFASGRNAQKVATLSLTGTDMYETAMDVAAQLELYVPFMRAVYDAFDRDYPEVFWLSGTMAYDYGDGFSVSYVDGEYQCSASLYLVLKDRADFGQGVTDYDMRNPAYQSQSALDAAIVARDTAIAEILTTEVRNMEPAKQIEAFNDILTKNNQYNTVVGNGVAGEAPLDAWECISALTGRIGTDGPVCEGYARALKVLCDEVNIPCVLVDGNAISGAGAGAHMWNYVQLDGNWYAVDVTWNDPVFSSDSVAVSGGEGKTWSLLGSDTVVNGMKFIDSHPVSNTASPGGVSFTNGPVLSAEKYSNDVALVRTDSGAEVRFEDIIEALNTAGGVEGSTLVLLKNVELAETYGVSGEFSLDLNGYTMDLGNHTLEIPETVALTLKDTSAEGDGRITSSSTITLLNSGTFRLQSGTIENTAEIEGQALNNGGEAVIIGGTIRATAEVAHAIWNVENAILDLYGGKLQASGEDSEGVFVQNGSTFNLSGGPIVEAPIDFCVDSAARISIVGNLTGEEIYTVEYYADDNGFYGFFAQAESDAQATAAKNRFVSVEDGLDVFAEGSLLGMDYRKGDIEISIEWDDVENRYHTRPLDMQVEIYKNGEFEELIQLTEAEEWKYTLEDVYLYNADGAIEYEMVLNDVDNKYIGTPGPSEDGYVIIASLKHKHDLELAYAVEAGGESYDKVVVRCTEEEGDCSWDNEYYSLRVMEPDSWPLIYDGEAKIASIEDRITPDFPDASVSEITYYKKNGNQWTAVTEVVDAGVYKAEVIVTLDGSTKAVWKEFEISKKGSNTLCNVQGINRVFDPWAAEGVEAVKVTLNVEGAVTEYSTDGGSTWSTTVPMMKEVGSLDVKVRVSAPNYETYEESITAQMTPYDISRGYLLYTEEEYYYSGEAVEPLIEGIYDSTGVKIPFTAEDYTLTYGNNVAADIANVCLTPTNSNYTGQIVSTFRITYYPLPENILYNGSETEEDWYRDNVVISAEGYTIRREGDTVFSDSITITEEGLWLAERVQFKQNGTGYITELCNISVNIDRTAPTFEAEDYGIYLGEQYWQTLATDISYDVLYSEDDILEFYIEDELPVYVEVYYYTDVTGSTTALTKAQLDELRNAGKFEVAENDELTLEDDGKYVVYAYAVDEAGNVSDYVSTNGIVKDTTAPEVVVVEPTKEAGTLKDTEMTFKVTADEDAMIGIYMLSDYSGESLGVVIYDDDYGYWESMETEEQIVDEDDLGVYISYKVFADADETKTITLTGLRPNTFYEYSVEVYDKAENGTVIAGERVEDGYGAYYLKGITTLKTTPAFAAEPTITGTYGQKLSEMTLSQPVSTNNVSGSWSIVYADDSQKDAILNVGTANSYQVKFTPSGENAEDYETVTVQVVPTVAKKSVTATIENVTITYGDAIPEFSCVTEGIVGSDELTMTLSTTAVQGSDAGTYTITGTCDSDNYNVTFVNGRLTIKKAQGTLSVESGKDVYNKTFGDDSFTLSGITSNNSEGQMSFAVSGDAVSVDAAGKVTIKGAGNAVITVSMPETKNYKAAEAVEITVNVAKAAATDAEISKDYLYLRDVQESIDLSDYVAADAGNVTYTVGEVTGECEFAVAPAVVNGKLTYTLKAGEVGEDATFTVSVSTDNYETFDISVTLKLVDKTPVEVKEGNAVSLKEDTLTYGEALSKLEFEEAVFVAEGTDEEVTGTLSWKTPDAKPDVATTKATWVFTPDSNEYMEVTGEVTIRVNKANQPALYIVDLGQLEFTPDDTLKTAITTTGGVQGGVVTFSVPSENGVIRLVEEKYFQILGVGDVTITAVCADPNGNYEDISTTYELKIVPCGLDEAQIKWAPGVTGEETYNGTEKEPAVVVYVEDELLREGIDYTVEYMNQKDAYTLQSSDEGFDAQKAPVVVVTGKGNYTGTLKKYFVIQQAQGTLSVASGKDVYNKTFGDDSFSLSGITTNNSEGQMSFAVSGDAVSVDAAGKVTIKGAGNAVITVSMPETKNYKAAEAVEITVNVAKAAATDAEISKDYLYLRDVQESIDLSDYVAADAGNVTYTVGAVAGECEFTVAPTVANGKLTYTLKAGEIGEDATFTVSVSSDNYETFDISVTLKLVDKTPIEGEVSLKENTLTYGEALSKLEFAETVFVAEGTDEEVTGTLSWKTPDAKPDVATTKATWVFTPDSNEYMEVTGEVTIVVEKADYPEITVVVAKPTVYGEYGYLTVDGAFADSQVTMTVPENNGVVKEIRATESGFEVEALKAGTITVTAVAHDITGNYKDGTATYELTVLPAELKAEWIGWAEGVTGEEIYTGDALIPQVVVKNDAVTLVQGEDYTVEYSNNTNAYEYVSGQEGFETSKAPVVTIIGKGNYEGEGSLYFVIKRAENAPNVPATEKTVANHVTKASQVSLPTDWIWQNPEQELAAEGANEVVAVYNGADKDNYVNVTAIVSITRQEAGIPYVEEINGTEVEQIEAGWNHVKDELQDAQEGDNIVVNMNGVTILPGEVLVQIKDKDITVVLDMGNDVEWHINGKSITAEEIPDVDLGVELNASNIPVDIINTITGEISTMQISLAYSGEFGYEAILRIGLGAENADYYAQLFYFENEASLSYIQEDVIDAEGYAELPFVHASDYVIVIDDVAYQVPGSGSGSGGNGGSTPAPAPTPVPTPAPTPVVPQAPTSPNTGDASAEPIVGMAVLFMMAALTLEYRRRKSNCR